MGKDVLEWDIGIVTYSGYDPDGFLSIQIDAFGDDDPSGKGGTVSGEVQCQGGSMFRPMDPVRDAFGKIDPTKSPQALFAWEGGRLHVIPTQDPRTVPGLPQLHKGERLEFGQVGNFTRYHDDGSISQYTTTAGGDPGGQSVYSKVKPTGFERIAPWGTERWDVRGYHLVTQSGARIDIGPSGMPSPLGGSSVGISADTVAIDGGLVTLGDPSKAQDKVALSTGTLAAFAAIRALIDVIKLSIPTVSVAAPGAGSAAIVAACTAAESAIDAAVLLVPTSSVTAA